MLISETTTPREAPRVRGFAVKKRPKQARACATFDAVVEAAARILAQEGFAALTTDRLVVVAGVGVGSVYEYFHDKETIVAEVVRRLLDELTQELTVSSANAAAALGIGPEAWLRAWLRAMFEAVRRRRGLLCTLFHEVPFLDQIEEVRQFPARLLAIATASPQPLHALPYVNPASIFLITVMVRSAVLESVIAPPTGVAAEEIEDTLVYMLLALLASSMAATVKPRVP